VRRLPNGNTFIDEGMNGRFFQVTPAGEIVWEYVSPYFGEAPLGPGGKEVVTNWVYHARPVPYDWVPAGTPHGEHAVVPPDLTCRRGDRIRTARSPRVSAYGASRPLPWVLANVPSQNPQQPFAAGNGTGAPRHSPPPRAPARGYRVLDSKINCAS